jgi:hypothetical protein
MSSFLYSALSLLSSTPDPDADALTDDRQTKVLYFTTHTFLPENQTVKVFTVRL